MKTQSVLDTEEAEKLDALSALLHEIRGNKKASDPIVLYERLRDFVGDLFEYRKLTKKEKKALDGFDKVVSKTHYDMS